MNGFEHVHALLQSFVERGPAGCACAVFHRGQTVFEDYVGYADVDAHKLIAPDTIYRIYSMTKVVTCVAALKLYERGLYLLNDPLEEYLPEFKDPQVYRVTPDGVLYTSKATRPILVKDLFTMSSGITYGGSANETERQVDMALSNFRNGNAGEPLTLRTLSKTLGGIPLAFDPGAHWRYGFSHDVIGALIEVLSGKTFGAFLHEEIFSPLGMDHTFFSLPEHAADRLACLYNRFDDGTLTRNDSMDADYRPGATFQSGGAGLLSTLGDYSRFAHALARGGSIDGVKLLGHKTIELMSSNHLGPDQQIDFNWPYLAGYGYGLGVRVMMDGPAGGSNSSLGEFGWCGLAGTWVMIDPHEELSAVYMQQMLPNFEAYHQPRLRAAIYGGLGA